MRLPPFQFLEPATVEEALSIMSATKETIKIMAGGTDLLNRMRLRLIEPAFVMSLGKITDMNGIATGKNETIIGANTKLKEIAHSPFLQKRFTAIAEAAFQVASPAIINMATIGGNLLQNTRCLFYNQSKMVLNGLEPCHKRGGTLCLAVKGGKRCFSVYQGDIAPALVAFEARCVLEKKNSSRTISITELFTGNGVTPFTIEEEELLTKIILPQPQVRFSSAYRKLRLRGSIDYPLASAAAFVSTEKDREGNACRVVLGAFGANPRVIDGPSCESNLDSVDQKAYELAEAVDNLQMPGTYRRKMAGVLAKRAVRMAMERGKEGET